MLSTEQTASLSPVGETSERGLECDFVPGTELLRDEEIANNGFVHARRHNHVLLVPQPEDDLHDPLNWSVWWKYACLVNMAVLSFLGNFTALSIAPLTPVFMKAFDVTVSQVALLTGGTVLMLGYANILIIPCCNIFGRRPIALVCTALGIGAIIWEGSASSYNSFLAARIVAGIGAATSESMMPVIVSDVMFLHERGTWMGVYFWSFFLGAFIGPIVSGNIGSHISWRWYFWLSLILQVSNFASLFFFFPETKYRRDNFSVNTNTFHTNDALSSPQTIPITSVSDKGEIEMRESTAVPGPSLGFPQLHRVVQLGHGYPSKRQRWSIAFKADSIGIKLLHRDIMLPFQLVSFPIVLFSACCLGFGANALLVLNLLESPAFSAPPYNFSPASVGLVNLALLVGAIVGLMTAGPFSDWVSMSYTRRNHGIREAEMRLPSIIPFAVIGMIGLVVASVGWQEGWAWEVIVIVGFGFTGVLVIAIPTIGLTYAIDSYKPIAGEIMVTATIIKNTYGFAMTYFVNDWAIKGGYIQPVMLAMALAIGIPVMGAGAFYFLGKKARKATRNSKVHSF